jgi:hypothetical protein
VQVAKGDDTRGALRTDADRQDLMLVACRAEDSQPKGASYSNLHQSLSNDHAITQCKVRAGHRVLPERRKPPYGLNADTGQYSIYHMCAFEYVSEVDCLEWTCLEGARPAPLPSARARTELQGLLSITPVEGSPGLGLKLPYGARAALPALNRPVAGVGQNVLVADGDDLHTARSCLIMPASTSYHTLPPFSETLLGFKVLHDL